MARDVRGWLLPDETLSAATLGAGTLHALRKVDQATISGEEAGLSNARAERAPMKVFVTVDVELWPSSWETFREEIAENYRRYIRDEPRAATSVCRSNSGWQMTMDFDSSSSSNLCSRASSASAI